MDLEISGRKAIVCAASKGLGRASAMSLGREGVAYEFGEACAFLCGAHPGFITSQNLIMDGGSFYNSISRHPEPGTPPL